MQPIAESTLRLQFFQLLFGEQEGFLCLASSLPSSSKESFKQHFFKWPDESVKAEEFILENIKNRNLWFCVNLLNRRERKKNFCLPTNLVWADLDTCNPNDVEPIPAIVLQSSNERYQALWRMASQVDAQIAEDYSKRIAYKYAMNGADPSGWDLTQLLRIPFTFNFKYASKPRVEILRANEALAPNELLEILPAAQANGHTELDEADVPDLENLPTADQIIYKYSAFLNKNGIFAGLYSEEPENDWSAVLWRLIHVCLEAGMTAEETFVVCNGAACNKYDRDNRPIRYLWRDVQKADAGIQKFEVIVGSFKPITMPEFVTEKEQTPTFIDEYKAWACDATDAVEDFHELCGMMILSFLCAGSLRLEASHGTVVPNLWGLILGDSTLTRKTTAMRMAVDIVQEIERDLFIATDGSAEGLLTGISTRPNAVSIFFRDEVTGLFDSFNKKDYLAGMPETLTNLYDVPSFYTRRLRKETITLQNPIFIFFGGGIRERFYHIVNEEYILSGFLPRFLVVSGSTNQDRIKRTGPPSTAGIAKRTKIVEKLVALYKHYTPEHSMKIGGIDVPVGVAQIQALLTDDAWDFYGDVEMGMLQAALESNIESVALPTFERLSRSMLKMSVLLAAVRQTPTSDRKIEVTKQDVMNATGYMQKWGNHSIELITNAGKIASERILDKIVAAVENEPGITRGALMQHYHLDKRQADNVFGTLLDRGRIKGQQKGRGWTFWPN